MAYRARRGIPFRRAVYFPAARTLAKRGPIWYVFIIPPSWSTYYSKGIKVEHTQLELAFEPGEGGEAATPAPPPAPPLPCRSQPMGRIAELTMAQQRANALHRSLCEATDTEIRLSITNNSSTMMSLRYEQSSGRTLVRLHHMFLDAPEAIIKALGAWILRPRTKASGKKLEAFIAEQRHLIAARPPRATPLRTRGRFVDLQQLYADVNREEFGNTVDTPITWGRMPSQRRRRSIRFGSYTPSDNLIRIHPYLDQDFVPAYFVRYIVFHEMLHAHMGIEEGPDGRRLIHPPAFRQREEAYTDYNRALKWMNTESNLRRLLHAPKR